MSVTSTWVCPFPTPLTKLPLLLGCLGMTKNQNCSVLVRKKTNMDLMASDFQSLVSELSLAGLVVGCPLDRQRNSSESVSVKLFIDELGKTGKVEGLKYTFWDECFTSKNVEYLVRPLQLHPVHEKSIVDKFAAVGILQGYLDYVNKKLKAEIPGKSV